METKEFIRTLIHHPRGCLNLFHVFHISRNEQDKRGCAELREFTRAVAMAVWNYFFSRQPRRRAGYLARVTCRTCLLLMNLGYSCLECTSYFIPLLPTKPVKNLDYSAACSLARLYCSLTLFLSQLSLHECDLLKQNFFYFFYLLKFVRFWRILIKF